MTLSESFYKEIIKKPFPVDLRVLARIRRSPLALDVYMWSTYRRSYLNRDTKIPWWSLKAQFGASYPNTPQGLANFKKKFMAAVKKIRPFDRRLLIEAQVAHLVLIRSEPSVGGMTRHEVAKGRRKYVRKLARRQAKRKAKLAVLDNLVK